MPEHEEKEIPKDFYGESDGEKEILSLARQYTNQSIGRPSHEEVEKDTALNLGRRLSRVSLYTLSDIDSNINPFIEPTEPILDPYSDKFNARAWTRHVIRFRDRDPDRYPHTSTGVSFRNLSAFGYGTGTDYQKTVANVPLEVVGMFRRLGGYKGEKVEILRNFDGLLKPGESCVVLGRPGRYVGIVVAGRL